MNLTSTPVITAADFVRNFGYVCRSSGGEPVFVTHHGHATHVLLTTERFQGMRAGNDLDNTDSSLQPQTANELANLISQAVITLDTDMAVIFANNAAYAMANLTNGNLIGCNIFEAIPKLEDSPAQGYIIRAMNAREACSAELPSVFNENVWVRLEVFPSARYTTIIVRDITQDVHIHRLADAKKAIVTAMELHGGIGYMRINLRGQIDRVDEPICAMLHLSQSRLLNVILADLVPIGKRVEFRERLNTVLSTGVSVQFQTELLANDGNVVPICGAITELRGAYGCEGAILVATRR